MQIRKKRLPRVKQPFLGMEHRSDEISLSLCKWNYCHVPVGQNQEVGSTYAITVHFEIQAPCGTVVLVTMIHKKKLI